MYDLMKVRQRMVYEYYDQLEGDSPFANAVNTKVSKYWTDTGREMPIEHACTLVLAEWFNESHA